MPQCGFSRASIQILGLQGVDPKKFTAFNVLEDESLRQGKDLRDFRDTIQVLMDMMQESRSIRNGQPYLSYTWTRSLWAVAIS